ncbi:MAG TPA: hypothetical protein VF176_06965 [Solirubrobacterales bacterium]
MIGTYASAALICAASLLVGRALLSFAGRRDWTWLEPAAGFAAILTVTGVLARAPGHATTAALGLLGLLIAAGVVASRLPYRGGDALRQGLPVAIVIVAILSIPFAVSGHWGLLGVGFNNDFGLHLAWAEWLRSGFGPAPEPGYPLGPHGLADATAAVPGVGLGQAFLGEVFAIGVLTALTALSALRGLGPGRRLLGAAMVAVPYLAASYFAQAAFKETAEALFILTVALGLRELDAASFLPTGGGSKSEALPSDAIGWLRLALVPLAIAGGIVFSYSFAGLAWPIAIVALWSLTIPAVRAALRPRTLLRLLLAPRTLIAIAVLAGLAAALTLVGPFGFIHSFNKVAGAKTYGPVSPVEALGIWPTPNYRLDAIGGAHLTGLAGAVGVLALLAGIAWWVSRRELAVPIALGACALLYLASLPSSGDYAQAKALMIAAPLAMLVAIRPLLAEFPRLERPGRARRSLPAVAPESPSRALLQRVGWTVLAVAFVGGAAYSSFLALRDAPVGPAGHGGELRAFLPIVHGQPVLYAGQDRYAAYELLGADTHVPLVEFPDSAVSQNPEKPFDVGNAYSPIDFDSFSQATLDGFPYVISGRAAWNSQAPRNFRRVAATPSFVLWKRTGPTPPDRHVLLEGTEAAAFANCASPELRILLSNPGRASLFPAPVIGPKSAWDEGNTLGAGERTAQTLRLPAGRWNLSLQYFSPFGLTLSAPGFSEALPAALDGQRPNTITLANDGQFWPAGRFAGRGGPVRFTISAQSASTLQRLTGYDEAASVGRLIAVPVRPHRIVPLREACQGWIDWYESSAAP